VELCRHRNLARRATSSAAGVSEELAGWLARREAAVKLRYAALLPIVGWSVAACAGSAGSGISQTASPAPPLSSSLASSPASSSSSVPAACSRAALRATLRAGGFGTGNDVGGIWIRNLGSDSCRLSGAVRFSARYADGTLDKQATTSGPVRPVAGMLPGGASAPTSSNPTAFTYLVAYLMGPERDDPTQPNGLCRAIDKLSPATLTLTIGSTPITVKNADPASATNKSIYGCHGRILLEEARLQHASSRSAPTSATTSARMSLAPPDTTAFPAKGCGPDSAPTVTVTINPDTPIPFCAIVHDSQRLRVVNATNAFNQPGKTITIDFAGLPERVLSRGQSTTYEQPFGSYLAPGEHFLRVSNYPGSGIVIWLK
jgi:hypothetical protein